MHLLIINLCHKHFNHINMKMTLAAMFMWSGGNGLKFRNAMNKIVLLSQNVSFFRTDPLCQSRSPPDNEPTRLLYDIQGERCLLLPRSSTCTLLHRPPSRSWEYVCPFPGTCVLHQWETLSDSPSKYNFFYDIRFILVAASIY